MKKKLLSAQNNIKRIMIFSVKSVDEQAHTVEGEFSHQVEDRQGDVVIQSGWDLKNYLTNPVVLWAHQHMEFPIGQMIEIGVNAENILVGKIKFAVGEYEKAATAFALVKGGYLRAFSVGFNNKKYEIDRENDIYILNENELYEVSVVNVGADQLALAKSKGIITEAEENEIKSLTSEESSATNKTESAVRLLSKEKKETIRSAIRALTEALNTGAEADIKEVGKKVEHSSQEGGIKKIPVAIINSCVKELLKIKKTQT